MFKISIFIFIIALFIDGSVNSLLKESSFIDFFEIVTFFGNLEVAISILILLSIYLVYKRDYFTLKLSLFAFLLTKALTGVLKFGVGRARPYVENSGFEPFTLSYDFFSFPSGHSSSAFILALIFVNITPKYRVIFFTLATLVASSRLFLNQHYLSDIVFGFIIAIFSFEIIKKKLNFKISVSK